MSSFVNALDFTGRRVLITGGGRGIGNAIVKAFVELNAQVIVLEVDPELIASLRAHFPTVTAVQVELKDWEATRAAVEPLLPIHHLINNAGVLATKPFLEIDLPHLDSVFDINYKGTLHVGQLVAKGMIKHNVKDGTIVNMSSCVDTTPGGPGVGIYASTKAAVAMLTRVMALELAPHGIRVTCIRPGACNTELVQRIPEEFKKKQLAPVMAKMVLLPQGELIETEEVAKAAVFLSSTLSSMVTGTALSVDAGIAIA